MLPSLFFLIIWSVFGPFGVWRLEKIKNRRSQLAAENINKAKLNAEMEEDIKRLKIDPNYQEQVIRKRLGFVKNGEIVYEFIDKKRDKN
ncbi:MAG: FtsB family cell division protein [Dissulfurimicrobium sp.]|uniref:FtsB family cell division protein n=1 Tax=Dissulfurimicrobium TaxID=1769732 RepID=UPI001EDB81E2|nr:septum formation initiator family protein [Dissulfurimicrobium hydrothermale]UKL13251.1 septum formation initiator family protein [Dissulfurimicrobium hydrothermale]